jgi:hypothetical protein
LCFPWRFGGPIAVEPVDYRPLALVRRVRNGNGANLDGLEAEEISRAKRHQIVLGARPGEDGRLLEYGQIQVNRRLAVADAERGNTAGGKAGYVQDKIWSRQSEGLDSRCVRKKRSIDSAGAIRNRDYWPVIASCEDDGLDDLVDGTTNGCCGKSYCRHRGSGRHDSDIQTELTHGLTHAIQASEIGIDHV